MAAKGGRGLGELAAALPSWRPGPTRDWICTTLASSVDVAPADRVAAFDNDGTLACEKPVSSARAYLTHLVPEAPPRTDTTSSAY